MGTLSGKRVLVVGASSGIGRAIAEEAVRAGADVVLSARRTDRLEAAVASAGGGTVIAADVRNPGDCHRIVDDAAAALGGLDLVVYSSAIMPYMLTAEQPAEDWRALFETNTIGALMVLTRATRHVGPEGLMAYISSDAVGAPYPGLVPYGASKAALDEGVRGLRVEHPNLRFCRVAVGPTLGTDIALGVNTSLQGDLLPELLRFGRITERQLHASDLGALIVEMLSPALHHAGAEVEEILIRPPGGPLPYGVSVDDIVAVIGGFTGPAAE